MKLAWCAIALAFASADAQEKETWRLTLQEPLRKPITLELEHIAELTQAIVERATAWCEGRVVSALEGGYAPQRVGAASVAHLRALMGA